MREDGKCGEGLAARLARHRLESRLVLHILAAALLTFIAAEWLGLEHGFWAVLTAIIVTQASLGGSLKAIFERLLGTIGGAASGIAAALIVAPSGPVTTGLALLLALAPVSVLFAFRPAYRVAPVTVVIVVLGSANSAVWSGLVRTFEIGFGAVIALAVALLFLPSHAHELLRGAAREALAAMARQVAALLDDLAALPEDEAVHRLNGRIRGAIERADGIAREAVRERASRMTSAPDPDPLVRTLRRVSHDLVMIARVRGAALSGPVCTVLAPPAAGVSAAVQGLIAEMDAALAGTGEPPSADAVREAVQQYDAAMVTVRREGLTRALPGEAAEQVFGLAFVLEQLGRDLRELSDRIAEVMRPVARNRRPGLP
ncbi:MAG TPA: FUSC family protein [Stellaceae bacterium]|nr:FUSC family protein [Stellaceae bacterium]